MERLAYFGPMVGTPYLVWDAGVSHTCAWLDLSLPRKRKGRRPYLVVEDELGIHTVLAVAVRTTEGE